MAFLQQNPRGDRCGGGSDWIPAARRLGAAKRKRRSRRNTRAHAGNHTDSRTYALPCLHAGSHAHTDSDSRAHTHPHALIDCISKAEAKGNAARNSRLQACDLHLSKAEAQGDAAREPQPQACTPGIPEAQTKGDAARNSCSPLNTKGRDAVLEGFNAQLQERLAELEQRGLRRFIRVVESSSGTLVSVAGRELVNFSSNDYLGLASHPSIAEAMAEGARCRGTGSTASRLICGTSAEHAALEEELAAAKRTDAALVFSTGMAAATGTIPALVGRGDVVILDKLAHACLIDGVHASGAKIRVYPHNDLAKLESHLQWARETHPKGRVLIVTESVFSMDGDVAPLREIVELKERYGAVLLLDEAHAVGVRGSGAQGLAGELSLGERIEIQMGTLGKALGVSGGYIAGSRVLIDFLINSARSFIFSTAPSPAVAAACREALRIVQSPEGDALRARLEKNILTLAHALGLPNPPSAIVPLILGNEAKALGEASRLMASGFFVPAIRYPTVPKNTARLRITLSAAHTDEQIAGLAAALAPAIP